MVSDTKPIDYSVQVPNEEEIKEKKQALEQKKKEVTTSLRAILAILENEEPFAGFVRRVFLHKLKVLTEQVRMLDQLAFNYFEMQEVCEIAKTLGRKAGERILPAEFTKAQEKRQKEQ